MKTETKHTPGPWYVHHKYAKFKRLILAGPVEPRRAIILAELQNCDIRLDALEVEANARLIASAPELLEALQVCLEFWDKPRPTFGLNQERKLELESIQASARTAIAKATGS